MMSTDEQHPHNDHKSIVIVGGGIAGVTCASTLAGLCCDYKIHLISSSPVIKSVGNFKQRGVHLSEFDVVEKDLHQLSQEFPSICVSNCSIVGLDTERKILHTDKSEQIVYDRLCICSGAHPKLIPHSCPEYVLGIRDTSSVTDFQSKLSDSKRILIVGNGGIATELVYSIEFCEIVWVIKDDSISSTFLDEGAAKFFTKKLSTNREPRANVSKRLRYSVDVDEKTSHIPGSALGPDWDESLDLKGCSNVRKNVQIEFMTEVVEIHRAKDLSRNKYPHIKGENITETNDLIWPIYVELSNNAIYGCDFVVSATGVIPNVEPFLTGNSFKTSSEGGICVDEEMRTTEQDVYAAGDVCTADWNWADYWFQMRLWTQARQMGFYAAQCIHLHMTKGESPLLYAPFEIFTHATSFYGMKVILLGLFNGQKLINNHKILFRIQEDVEYVKVIIQDSKLKGALLIGETDLEECFENLIINQLNVSNIEDELLNPSIDIEDYFD
ncbi:pyridine nucleotide-disulfide oxidoreductase domain 1 [Brevipalpus obovatus]|uniref:pyridine nucleotide-disulfide oxidoreductase domain 1 n=1 Tax=Brevipalpus obovatus TaxID=246614 RepID=UPI003D9FA6CD